MKQACSTHRTVKRNYSSLRQLLHARRVYSLNSHRKSLRMHSRYRKKQSLQQERYLSTCTSTRQPKTRFVLSTTRFSMSHPFLSILTTCNCGRSIASISLQQTHSASRIGCSRSSHKSHPCIAIQRTPHCKHMTQAPSR